jgi:hypothetical protein
MIFKEFGKGNIAVNISFHGVDCQGGHGKNKLKCYKRITN